MVRSAVRGAKRRRRARRGVGTALLIAALVVPAFASPARANDGPAAHDGAAPAEPKDAAQALVNEGLTLLVEFDLVAALERFRAAYAVYPSPKILLNIGTTLRMLGRNAEAADAYERYLRAPSADAGRREEVERILGEIEQLVCRLRVEVQGSDVEVLIDGKLIEGFKSGASIRMDPGEHTVIGYRPGYPAAVQTVRLSMRQERTIRLQFMAAPVVVREKAVYLPDDKTRRNVALAFGGVGVVGLSAGAIFGLLAKSRHADGTRRCLDGTRACAQAGVDLIASAFDYADASTVGIAAGATALATGAAVWLEGTQRKIVLAGFGATGLALGGLFGAVATARGREADAYCWEGRRLCDLEGLDLANKAETYAALSTLGFIVGGVALAADAVLLFTTASSSPPAPTRAPGTRPAVQVVTTWHPAGASVALGGTF